MVVDGVHWLTWDVPGRSWEEELNLTHGPFPRIKLNRIRTRPVPKKARIRAWCLSLTVDTTVYFSGCRREMPTSKLSARLPSYTAHALSPEVDRGTQASFPHALCHQRRRNEPTRGVDPQPDRLKARINSRAAALVSAILPRQRPWESDSLSVLFPDTTRIAAGTVPHP